MIELILSIVVSLFIQQGRTRLAGLLPRDMDRVKDLDPSDADETSDADEIDRGMGDW